MGIILNGVEMLVLTRKAGQKIVLDFSGMTDEELASLRAMAPVKIAVVEMRGDNVRIGFEAPLALKIYRQEVYDLKPI